MEKHHPPFAPIYPYNFPFLSHAYSLLQPYANFHSYQAKGTKKVTITLLNIFQLSVGVCTIPMQ